MTIDLSRWNDLLTADELTTWAYFVTSYEADADGGADLRFRALREKAAADGAPDDDLAALDEAFAADGGVTHRRPRYVAARSGSLVWDQAFDDEVGRDSGAGHAPVPDIWPLIDHAESRVPFLLVEASRDGGEVSLRHAGRAVHHTVEGSDPHLSKVRGGGWSHRRLQAHTEDVWRRNAVALEDDLESLWRSSEAELVVMAGDVRAREKVRAELPSALADVVVEVDRHTRPEGADSDVIDEALAAALDDRTRSEEDAVLESLAVQGARGEECLGRDAVERALAERRVQTLVVDAEHTGPPSLSLLRGAVRAGAAVLQLRHREMPQDAGVAAVVRWTI
jgi:hypothetical protein